MTQKKDRRSARTRKREEVKSPMVVAADGNSVCKKWSAQVEWCLCFAGATFSTYPLPSFPRSHSSSAPMVPEVSQ